MIEASFQGGLGDFQLDAAFTVPASGVTGLIGPSGSGKTSLLRCIAGLNRLEGRLVVDGEVWQDDRIFLPTHRRPIGYVFQEPSLLEHLSVRGNLMFGYRRARTPHRIGLDEVIALLGLEPLLGRSTLKLSGGERQRTAIGRALLSQPTLLLLDEPLASLDQDGKAEILTYLDRLRQTLAIPAIHVSHDPVEIARVADRLLVMSKGRVVPGEATGGDTLAGLDPDDIRSLARAALAAGLKPLDG